MRRRRTLVAVALLSALAGCVSVPRTPEPRYFVLRALATPPPSTEAAASTTPAAGVVAVLGVRIPDHLERPQLVLWTAQNELRIDEFLRWAEPLDAGVTRTLADDLEALLPGYRVVRAPWPAALRPRCRIATELRVFGTEPDGRVTIDGSFALLAAEEERALARRNFAITRGAAGSAGGWDPGRAVEEMSQLLLDVAKEIASAVAALPPQPPPEPARQGELR